jgi:hypothetical protein
VRGPLGLRADERPQTDGHAARRCRKCHTVHMLMLTKDMLIGYVSSASKNPGFLTSFAGAVPPKSLKMSMPAADDTRRLISARLKRPDRTFAIRFALVSEACIVPILPRLVLYDIQVPCNV